MRRRKADFALILEDTSDTFSIDEVRRDLGFSSTMKWSDLDFSKQTSNAEQCAVFRALHIPTQKAIALKKIAMFHDTPQEILVKLKIMCKTFPNVVQLFDAFLEVLQPEIAVTVPVEVARCWRRALGAPAARMEAPFVQWVEYGR